MTMPPCRVLLIGLALVLALDAPVSAMDESEEAEMAARRLAMTGSDMSAAEAAALEVRVEQEPGDLAARTQLLGYYMMHYHDDPQALERRRTHILWVIENHPASPLAGLPYVSLDPRISQEAVAAATELWREHVEAEPGDAKLIANAASFFVPYQLELAEQYLEQGRALEPQNPSWLEELARVYGFQVQDAADEQRDELAAKALAAFEAAYELHDDEIMHFYMLNNLAEAALTANANDKAQTYARRLLDMAERYKGDWNYGNAIHAGHLTLGHLALRAGDVEQAAAHLLDAGRTPGSPQLNSFGPDRSLAQALLDAGEREAVLEYLELIERFWVHRGERLQHWREEIRAGRTPDLRY
ncbi:MAG: hypothetical protein WD316_08995 [Phycisphaeraceae bacterium]